MTKFVKTGYRISFKLIKLDKIWLQFTNVVDATIV